MNVVVGKATTRLGAKPVSEEAGLVEDRSGVVEDRGGRIVGRAGLVIGRALRAAQRAGTVAGWASLLVGVVLSQACGGMGAEPNPAGGIHGTPPAEDPSVAVASVDSEEEDLDTYPTMVDMLRGRVTGLQISEGPGGNIQIRIRGTQSINANTDPLLVVDGVTVPPYSFSSTLRTIDPRDVRSIQVLKDAGSTSMYGSRGAAGVILIKLKRS